jgi:hypothetical protein
MQRQLHLVGLILLQSCVLCVENHFRRRRAWIDTFALPPVPGIDATEQN